MGLIEDYFKLTSVLKERHGDKSVILMQNGTFYEIYGLKRDNDIVGSSILDLSKLCDLHIADKKLVIDKIDVVQAGFGIREHIMEKYLKKMVSNEIGPDLLSLNCVLRGYARNQPRDAFKFLQAFNSKFGVEPDSFSFATVHSALTKKNNNNNIFFQKETKMLLDEAKLRNIRIEGVVFNSILDRIKKSSGQQNNHMKRNIDV